MTEQSKCPRCGGEGQEENGREVFCSCCLAVLRIKTEEE